MVYEEIRLAHARQQLGQMRPGVVVTHDADELHLGAKRGQILHHVAGAPNPSFSPIDLHHEVAVVLLEIDRHSHQSAVTIAGKVVRGLVLNPLILSASCGLAWNALALPMPVALSTFLDLMGDTAGPCALFAMGLFLVGKPLRHGLGEVVWVSLVKLIVMPAVTWWLAFDVFVLDPFWARSAVLLAALPTGALVFVVAQRYEVYTQRAISAILINTVLSVITLSILLPLLGIG